MKHVNVALFVPHEGCPNTCIFCNQRAISGKTKRLTPSDVHNAVGIALKSEFNSASGEIAFFGGSFTAIDREYMVSLLQAAYPYVEKGFFKGIRCSTRPDAVDDEVLSILKKYGVSSIELGAQSMIPDVLIKNERGHTPEDTKQAASLIKSFGFELGLQMMTGLYSSTDEDDIFTAREIIKMKPKTVRIYPTAVLKGTKLANLFLCGDYIPSETDHAAEICSLLLEEFNANNIKVIRLGLHSGGSVEDDFIAGVYHPAFRELCEGKIYLRKAQKIIKENKFSGKIKIYVNSVSVSKMTGQKKVNLKILQMSGINASVCSDNALAEYELRVEKED